MELPDNSQEEEMFRRSYIYCGLFLVLCVLIQSFSTPEMSLEHADCDFFPKIYSLLCIMGMLRGTIISACSS